MNWIRLFRISLKNPKNFRKATVLIMQNSFQYFFNIFFNICEDILSLLIYFDWRIVDKTSEKILLCRDRGHSQNDENDDGGEKYQIKDTLKKYGCEVVDFLWNDTGIFVGSQLKLWLLIIKIRPKIIIFSSYSCHYSAKTAQPSKFFIDRAVKKSKSKIIFLWWDSVNSNFYNHEIAPLKGINGLHVLMDNPTINLKGTTLKDNRVIGLHSLFVENSMVFPREKNINISFFGQISSYRSSRGEYLEFLMENNIPIYLSVNERNNQCSYNKYCNILGRSKIVINFSMSVDAHQLKGRPIEAFYSESLLLETYNAQTSSLFREGVDYVGFSNKEDMLEKVKYYLSNPREAEKIAKSGKERCLSLYNLESFWGRIFNEL